MINKKIIKLKKKNTQNPIEPKLRIPWQISNCWKI